MTQPSARERIESLWDRATPVTPLLDEHTAEVRAAVLDEAIKAVLARLTAYEGMGQDMVALNRERSAIAEMFRRMAEEGR